MDQKRLMLAIAISVAIILAFQYLVPHAPPAPHPPAQQQAAQQQPAQQPGQPQATPAPAAPAAGAEAAAAVPREVPRVKIDAPRVQGSISLLGGRIDDLILRDYRETIAPDSPHVRLLEPRADPLPYYVQFGWSAAAGAAVKLPDANTTWQSTPGPLAPGKPVTLSWDNGEGLTFAIELTVDDEYMFGVRQTVRNAGSAAVELYPWSRIRREYTPHTQGYYILHEGLLGVFDRTLKEMTYATTKTDAEKNNGVAFKTTTTGGWAGITDKYWLVALVPDQAQTGITEFQHIPAPIDGYQVGIRADRALTVPAGGEASAGAKFFAGAKVVQLLAHYEEADNIPLFSYAVDFGWFWFLTKPIFYALDWLYKFTGNFGIAILIFTFCVKLLFFPLANKSYRSMSKMKLLAPKMTALREQYKDDAPKLQSAMMQLYKAEKVNPASGCLPIVIQIPVFFSLYKVIFTTIELRHAPFFGWIHDLSAVDPTNVFNLFGLLPFDPVHYFPLLHLGIWPLVMGVTMFLQQKLNPPPPDPVQAKVFQFMPLIFTFMLAGFPAGLVIYWTWNNLLTIGQQWLIMRRTTLDKPRLART